MWPEEKRSVYQSVRSVKVAPSAFQLGEVLIDTT